MANNKKSLKKDDLVLEYLEMFQYWISDHYKSVLFLFVAAVVGAFSGWIWQEQQEGFRKDLQAKASSLETVEEKRVFIQNHPDSDASLTVYLSLSKQELDKGEFEKANAHAKAFLRNYPSHSLEGLAHLFSGYAEEELGQIAQAKASYLKASETGSFVSSVAQKALDELSGLQE